MSDEIEVAEAAHDTIVNAQIQTIRNIACSIPKGEPGECFYCGEYFARIVNTACCRCRDMRKLP